MKFPIFIAIILFSFACENKSNDEINPKNSNPDWAIDSHSNDVQPDYSIVFPQEKVNVLEITIGKTNWEAIKVDMVAKNKGTFGVGGGTQGGGGVPPVAGGVPPAGGGGGVTDFGLEPAYVTSSVKFNGKKWENVGFRLKGNSTLSSTWKSGIYKLPFRLKMDEFEDKYPEIKNQRMYGFKDLSFSPGAKDNSLIREKVASDIFRMAGIPSAQTSFYKVYIDFGDGLKYCGVYTVVEVVDDTMVKSQFGEDKGNIYKPESNFTTFNATQFEKKNNETEADFSDVQGAVTALNAPNRTTDPAAWRSNLEKFMNMDHFVKWLAINSTLVSWDTYGGIAHNYYLYNHPTKKLLWIPWDNNEALTSQERVKITLTGIASNWPLIKYVNEDPVYYAKYKAEVKEFTNTTFTPEKMNAMFDKATNMITPFVNGAEKEVAPYTHLTNSNSFTSAIGILKQHVVTRNTVAKAFAP